MGLPRGCLIVAIIALSNSAWAEAGSICNLVESNVGSVSVETTASSDWSMDGQCQCDLSFSRETNLDVHLNVAAFQTDSTLDTASCSPLLVFYLSKHTFFHCPSNRSFTSRLSFHGNRQETPLQFRLFNPSGKNVRVQMSLSNTDGELFNLSCKSMEFSLDLQTCPCVDEYREPIGLLPGHTGTPTSKRILVGFMCALALLVLFGIFVLLVFLVRRGHIKPIGPLKYLMDDKELKDPYNNAKEKEAAVASNLGFIGDSQDSLNKNHRTPVANSIGDLYATVDLSTVHTELPFTPDKNLRLDLKNPYEGEPVSKYRGSLDSGLYSEISSERMEKQSRGNNNSNSFPALGTTSMETLQTLGPGHQFEPPAGQSSPKPPPKVGKDVEAIYAQPDKTKKAKYRNQAAEPGNNGLQPASSRTSIQNLQEYNPRRLGLKSGSTSSVNDGQVAADLSGSKSGSLNMMPTVGMEQPKKVKKKKKKKPKGLLNSGSEQSLDVSSSKPSVEHLPEYHPKPLQKRSGSSQSVNSARMNLSGSVNMIPNAIYEGFGGNPTGRNSRSSNELYMTDGYNDSHGSHMTIETDV